MVGPLVVENTGTMVPLSQGTPGRASPPHRSATRRPSTKAAKAAPTSPRSVKLAAKASATASNPGATDPGRARVMATGVEAPQAAANSAARWVLSHEKVPSPASPGVRPKCPWNEAGSKIGRRRPR